MYRFTIRDMLWLTLVVALAVGRWKASTEVEPPRGKHQEFAEIESRQDRLQ